MPLPTRFPALAALVAALAVLAGCGSSSSSSTNPTAAFKQGYQPAVNGFAQAAQAIGLEIERAAHQSDAEVETRFRALAAEWQAHVDQLRGLKPPSTLATPFATLTGAAIRAEADLSAAALAAQTHNVANARRVGADMVRNILAAKAAATTINQKLGIR
jgi:hypothetical protein